MHAISATTRVLEAARRSTSAAAMRVPDCWVLANRSHRSLGAELLPAGSSPSFMSSITAIEVASRIIRTASEGEFPWLTRSRFRQWAIHWPSSPASCRIKIENSRNSNSPDRASRSFSSASLFRLSMTFDPSGAGHYPLGGVGRHRSSRRSIKQRASNLWRSKDLPNQGFASSPQPPGVHEIKHSSRKLIPEGEMVRVRPSIAVLFAHSFARSGNSPAVQQRRKIFADQRFMDQPGLSGQPAHRDSMQTRLLGLRSSPRCADTALRTSSLLVTTSAIRRVRNSRHLAVRDQDQARFGSGSL